tara:strand:- start:77 stop:1585 length:1509 start_codon:yes stop_codon:yes gene_type:complete
MEQIVQGIVFDFVQLNDKTKAKPTKREKRRLLKRVSLAGQAMHSQPKKKAGSSVRQAGAGFMHPPMSRGGMRNARPVLVSGSRNDPRRLVEALKVQAMARSGPLRSESVGDMVHLDSSTIPMGRHALAVPVRSASLTAEERLVLDGAAPLSEHGTIRKGVAGWAKVSTVAAKRNPETIKAHVKAWVIYVREFCDPEGYDPWYTSPTVFELFVGYMYEKNTTGDLARFSAAINYMHQAHNLVAGHIGGRFAEAKSAFVKAQKLRRHEAGTLTFRALIPDHAMLHFVSVTIPALEIAEEWAACDQAFIILSKAVTWTRAISMGATLEGDFDQTEYHFLVTIRKTKCGNEEFQPIQFSIPFPEEGDGNEIAAMVMGFLSRNLTRNPNICAKSVGITRKSASDKITKWMQHFMPQSLLKLPPGSYISSHSTRDTGATHAKRSLFPSCGWDTIMSWGGWLTEKRCKGYIKFCQPSLFWGKFYYWLCPAYKRQFHAPRAGYAEDAVSG